jgi:hypothetical protein
MSYLCMNVECSLVNCNWLLLLLLSHGRLFVSAKIVVFYANLCMIFVDDWVRCCSFHSNLPWIAIETDMAN